MITVGQLVKQINDVTTFLFQYESSLDFNSAIVRPVGRRHFVTWAGAPESLFVALPYAFGTVEEYRTLVANREYNLMMPDGALLQYGYVFEKNTLLEHRLSFYPCPFALDPNDVLDIQPGDDFVALIDVYLERTLQACVQSGEDASHEKPSSALRLRTPIRFDFNPSQQASLHSASHVHIDSDDCRLPVFGPLSVGHFTRFVVRNFYPQIWSRRTYLQGLSKVALDRSIEPHEEQDLFLNCTS